VKILIDMNLTPVWFSTSLNITFVEHTTLLERGALITLDPDRQRTRILPIVPGLRT
jgi:hypothetical protein